MEDSEQEEGGAAKPRAVKVFSPVDFFFLWKEVTTEKVPLHLHVLKTASRLLVNPINRL